MMKRTQIYIPEDTHVVAQTIAKRRKEPVAGLLRRIIVRGLEEERRKLPQQNLESLLNLGLKGGPKNLSRDMDKYLYGS